MTTQSIIPKLVQRALKLAGKNNFAQSCTYEVGKFLQISSGLKRKARIAEIGMGYGVGSAWILSGMSPDSNLITIDHKQEQIEQVRKIFINHKIEILQGGWKSILTYGPFDFVFIDIKEAKFNEADLVIDAVNLDGIIILDDFTPMEHWPDAWEGKPDLVREKWLNDARLLCMEVRTSERSSILFARKVKLNP
ncbi:O-methyltransferase [Paenibacillus lautus]|uniref:O-methyltransferase n=1 Tax=Paenibacillus lautus TaxID=1401 RepID=UPI000FD9FADE|nr:class I SAM-dependent methyltransferase [Paenibacillus lautus]